MHTGKRIQAREIDTTNNLKASQIRETVLMKKPTHADLRTALYKHKDNLGTFYQRKEIKKITEDQLKLGEESISLGDADIHSD